MLSGARRNENILAPVFLSLDLYPLISQSKAAKALVRVLLDKHV